MALTADEEGPDDGHTFRILFDSRGSYSVVGDAHHTDSPDFDGTYHVVEVRAWSLRDALLKAADLPFPVLLGTELVGQPVDVIEPTPEPDPDVSEGHVYDWLMMVKDEIPGKRVPPGSEILKWDQPTRREVMRWAVAIHLVASDNDDVVIPPMPAVLQPPAALGGGTTLLSRCTCRGGSHGGYTCPDCR